MTEAFAKQIETEARQAMTELVAAAKLKKGDVLVVGCSSSEMVGGHIGKDSSIEAARALYAGAAPVLAEKGVWLAAQCCEHLNRAIILERKPQKNTAGRKCASYPVPMRAAAGPLPAGRTSKTRWRWKRSAPTRAWISAAP